MKNKLPVPIPAKVGALSCIKIGLVGALSCISTSTHKGTIYYILEGVGR